MIAGLRLLEIALPMLTMLSPPDSVWTLAVGGTGDERCYSIAQASNQTTIAAGRTASFGAGELDGWLLAVDDGDTLWSRSYGGADEDAFEHIEETAEGGFIVGGFTRSWGAGQRDFWLMNMDSTGNPIYSRTYGGRESDVMTSLLPLHEGGILLAGNTRSFGSGDADCWLVKVNNQGDSLWSHTYGGTSFDDSHVVIPVSTGGFLLIGHTSSFDNSPYSGWIVRVGSEGDSLWSRTLGGHSSDRLWAGYENSQGDFLLAGSTDLKGAGGQDYWLVRTDSLGNALWDRTYGGPADDICYRMCATNDGGAILAGNTYSYGSGASDIWILRVSAKGDSLWSTTVGGESVYEGWAMLTKEESIWIGGFMTSPESGSEELLLMELAEKNQSVAESTQ